MSATILEFPSPVKLDILNAYKDYQLETLQLSYQALYNYIANTHPEFPNKDELKMYEDTIALINKCTKDSKEQEERVLKILKADALGEDITDLFKELNNSEELESFDDIVEKNAGIKDNNDGS